MKPRRWTRRRREWFATGEPAPPAAAGPPAAEPPPAEPPARHEIAWSDHALERLEQRAPQLDPATFLEELVEVRGALAVLVRGHHRADGWAVHPETGVRAVLRQCRSSADRLIIVTVLNPHPGLATLFQRLQAGRAA